MKSFKNHLLLENLQYFDWRNGSSGVCEILTNPKPPCRINDPSEAISNSSELRDIIYYAGEEKIVKPELHVFFNNLHEWISGMQRASRDKHEKLANDISYMVKSCGSKRKGWNRFRGKVYRGVMIDTRTASDIKIDTKKNSSIDFGYYGNIPHYEGSFRYQSNLPAQSWSNEKTSAFSFIFSKKKNIPDKFALRVVMEYDISPDESLTLKYLGNRAEREIIRLSNAPINVKIYVPYSPNPNHLTPSSPNFQYANNYSIVKRLTEKRS